MSKRLHPKRRARMMAETLFFFPQHPPDSWIIKKVGPYWVWKRHPDDAGHKPTQMVRVEGHGQLSRRRG